MQHRSVSIDEDCEEESGNEESTLAPLLSGPSHGGAPRPSTPPTSTAPPRRLQPVLTLLLLLLSSALLWTLLPNSSSSPQGSEAQPSWLTFSSLVPSSLVPSDPSFEAATEAEAEEFEEVGVNSASPVVLSEAVREAAWMVTARADAAPLLSPSTAALLHEVLQGVATALLSLRPSIQRALWLSDCSSYLPCPYPNSDVRREKPNSQSDADVHQWILQQQLRATEPHGTSPPTEPLPPSSSPSSPSPSPSLLFHALSHVGQHWLPGEPLEAQSLAMRFQDELYARQHPPDCSAVPVLVMDYFHDAGGFGSWSHARAVALGLGIRGGRTVIELAGGKGYTQGAYSDCTRSKGLGGCDIFLPASSCTLPDDWRQWLERDKAEFAQTHPPWRGGSLQQHLEHLKDRRIVQHTEYYLESEAYELYHTNPLGWDRGQLFSQLPSSLDAYRVMPECWWNRQLLSYHWRMRPEPTVKLLTLVGQSLRLPQPDVTARNAMAYAAARSPSVNHTAHWWLCIQAVKLVWQIEQVAPHLTVVMGEDTSQAELSRAPVPHSAPMAVLPMPPVPFLSWAFMRHGDKGQETQLFSDDVYLSFMLNASRDFNLSVWYVGADDLHTGDRIREAITQLPANATIRLHTSALVDAIGDKEQIPHSTGWQSERMKELTDEDREAIVWRTMLDLAVSQVADAFLSIWSSNQPRIAYALNTACSDARVATPFIGLDMIPQHRKTGVVGTTC